MTPRVPINNGLPLTQHLQDTPLWSALHAQERERILLAARLMTAEKREVLITEGDVAQAMFVVVDGALRLTRVNGRGARIIAGFLFRGDIVGACIADRYPFSVEAMEDVTLCRFERRLIRDINRENQGFEWRMITAASNEFLQCQMHLDIVMGGSVEAKLARFLMHLGERIGVPAPGGMYIPLPMGREDIAHYLGHSLETISRAFTKLREHGAIAVPQRTELHITDNCRLARIAEMDN